MREESFIFEGSPVTYYRGGAGNPLLLLHGSGPGASSIGNWGPVLDRLSQRYEIFAMDLLGFGKSGRKAHPPYFDYGLWVRQANAMLDVMDAESVGLIGHSLSGSIALSVAADNPRVAAVLTTGTMGIDFAPTSETRLAWRCPRDRDKLRVALCGLVHDRSRVDDAYLAVRAPVVFAPGYADYFDQMFSGDASTYVRAAILGPDVLQAVRCPVMLVHGREDKAFPLAASVTLGERLNNADVLLLRKCSHSVALERTDTLLATIDMLFSSVFVKNDNR